MKKLLLGLIIISNAALGQTAIDRPQHDVPKVVNEYTEVLAFNICTNQLTVADATLYKTGDTVLMIQMKGAIIDTSNTASFGTVLEYKNAGNYEMNYISAKLGNTITLKNKLTRQYDIPAGVVQLIRVPYFKTTNYVGEFTCPSWDGGKGGVLVLNAQTINLGDDIEVSGKGFRRGELGVGLAFTNCFENSYVLPAGNGNSVFKGESIATVSQNLIKGKASLASGGGAGLSVKSGGGGGANAGIGGFGGYQSDTCTSAPFDNRGMGGRSLAYSTTANKIFMGGGAGAGHAQDIGIPTPLEGAGGGIAIIIADQITSGTNKIIANGGDGVTCSAANCNQGMVGGGGGGTVLLYVNQILDDLQVEVKVGKGASVSGSIMPGGRVGPGGGGGGGVFFLNRNALPASITSVNTSGGFNGVIYADANNAWGATSGTQGITLFNLPDLSGSVLFKQNIDSVRINNTINYCNNIQFKGFGFTNTYPLSATGWQWYFGDGGTSTAQNPIHNYNAVGNYDVKLIATDINGCKDSIINNINSTGSMMADAGPDTSFCAATQKTITLSGSGTAGTYLWVPALVLNNNTLQNPTATINTTTKFYLTVSNGTGCAAADSVTVATLATPIIKATKSNDLNCNKPFTQLNASGASSYTWLPPYALSNDSIANPIANPAITTTYYVYGKDTSICAGTDSIKVIADFKNHGIILPNIFTPNNDGLNDCFGIQHYRDIQNLELIIFNRYGSIVFKTNNASNCWDGNFKGKPASPGNYVYYIKAKTLCGNVAIKDSVLLLR
jgi:gliding motility-associated-like protein